MNRRSEKGIKIIDLGGMKCSRSATMDMGCCLPSTGLVASLRRLYPVNKPCSRSATVDGEMLSVRAQACLLRFAACTRLIGHAVAPRLWKGDAVCPGTGHAVATGLGIGRIESIYELLV